MSTQEIINIINQYFDNELTKAEEILLFTQLSQDDEAREYFKQQNLLKTTTEQSIEEYPEELDEEIFAQLKREDAIVKPAQNKSTIFAAISYGFALVLLVVSIFFFSESMQYRNKLEVTSQQVNQQNQLIQVLYNTLPQAEVVEKVQNEIIVTSQM